jgi:hypothetical protein
MPSAERRVLQERLANVKETIRERLRDGHSVASLSELARRLKKRLDEIG